MTERIIFDFLRTPGDAASIALLIREPYDIRFRQMSLFSAEDLRVAAVGARGNPGTNGSRPTNSEIGNRLYKALCEAKVGKDVLDIEAFSRAERLPLYFDLSAVDELNDCIWELLCTEHNRFLALDRWPVARMLQSQNGAVMRRTLRPPLRIAAVLSCLGVEPKKEWEALRGAVEESDAETKVLLLLSDTDLYDELSDARPAWLTVAMIPTTYSRLQSVATRFKPNILHFFCHGSLSGRPHLEIATANDVARLKDPEQIDVTSTHRLEAPQVRELVRHGTEAPWAVVLNACGSAHSGEESGVRSLAASLVRDLGVQAVVGMREPVLETDAACFTGGFYLSLFEAIREQTRSSTSDGKLDWPLFTLDARKQICQSRVEENKTFGDAAASDREWALPIVMVRGPESFAFEVRKVRQTRKASVKRKEDQFMGQLIANLPDAQRDAMAAAMAAALAENDQAPQRSKKK